MLTSAAGVIVTEALDGVTAIETRTGADTVNPAEPETAPRVAVIVADPTPELVARPCDPEALLTTATLADDEDHVTFVVIVFVLLSVYVPVAVNC